MIDLYYLPGAASLVVHATLEEAGAEYNLIRTTRENGVFGPPEAARLNPAGRVPTMSFDGMAMTESVACLMHISDLYPEAALAPAAGTPERGQWYRWLVYLLSPVQSTFYGFIAPRRSAPGDAQDAVKAHAIDALDGFRSTLDTHLATSGPYLLGERPPARAAVVGRPRPRQPLPGDQVPPRGPAGLRAGTARRRLGGLSARRSTCRRPGPRRTSGS